jgi:ribosomal 30S subunit maturation factor RimM
MESKSKFSQLVEELALTWWEWMKADTLCRNEDIPYKKRAIAAKNCEKLIKQEYNIIQSLDSYFE